MGPSPKLFVLFLFCVTFFEGTLGGHSFLQRRFPYSVSGFCGAHTFVYLPDDAPKNPLRGFVPNVEDELDSSLIHSLKFAEVDLGILFLRQEIDWDQFLSQKLAKLPPTFQLVVKFSLRCPSTKPKCHTFTPLEDLFRRIQAFFFEFATRFDADNRIGFLAFGDIDLPEEGSDLAEQLQKTFIQSLSLFKKKRFSLSSSFFTPSSISLLQKNQNFGLFDATFSNNTYSAREQDPSKDLFYNKLIRYRMSKRWETAPLGGIAASDIEEKIFNENWKGDNLDIDIQRTHATWIKDDKIFSTKSKKKRKMASRINLTLGYQFFIKRICLRKCLDFPQNSDQSCVIISVLVQNRGNAPFYYPLQMVVETHDGKKSPFDFDFSNLLPASRTYTVSQKVVWKNDKKSEEQYRDLRKIKIYFQSEYVRRPILFANKGVGKSGAMKLLVPRRCVHVSKLEKTMSNLAD